MVRPLSIHVASPLYHTLHPLLSLLQSHGSVFFFFPVQNITPLFLWDLSEYNFKKLKIKTSVQIQNEQVQRCI